MGMYTEILVKATLRSDLSENILEVVDYMFGEGELPEVLPKHKLFRLPRWDSIGKCGSWYHHPTAVNSINKDYTAWEIFSRSDIKNYNGEIEAFFDWFKTIIDASEGRCIGYTWYEETSKPTLIIMTKE